MIRLVTLGVLAAEIDHDVREEGGNNLGPRMTRYRENADPPIGIAVPWCALGIQFGSDIAAAALGIPNPLDAVRQEALVQSYFDELREHEIESFEVEPGDLSFYKFGRSERAWDHIGIVAVPPAAGDHFRAIEGNTSDDSQRDGDAWAFKDRRLGASYPVTFCTWGRPLALD
ncbi:hypothetical protein LCGC14_2150450 [marine sediment metagenome]|uniref:Peptidase C51 domain-containing protein n=1 Tax=marine sediment metagenome TaxID=412755 RepID=A0A0F9EHZ9_9ZZZZ